MELTLIDDSGADILPLGAKATLLSFDPQKEDYYTVLTIAIANTLTADRSEQLVIPAAQAMFIARVPTGRYKFTARDTGKGTLPEDLTVTVTTRDGAPLPEGLKARIYSLVYEGRDAPASDEPGADAGACTKFGITFYNETGEDIVLDTEEKLKWKATIEGTEYFGGVNNPVTVLKSGNPYTTAIPETVLAPPLNITETRISFAAPLVPIHLFVRWSDDLNYVGEEFNINWAAAGSDSHGVNRYLQARRYRNKHDVRRAYRDENKRGHLVRSEFAFAYTYHGALEGDLFMSLPELPNLDSILDKAQEALSELGLPTPPSGTQTTSLFMNILKPIAAKLGLPDPFPCPKRGRRFYVFRVFDNFRHRYYYVAGALTDAVQTFVFNRVMQCEKMVFRPAIKTRKFARILRPLRRCSPEQPLVRGFKPRD
jgi:hypothetical protein